MVLSNRRDAVSYLYALILRRQRTPSAITVTLKLKVMQVGGAASCGKQLMSNAVSSYGSQEI